MPGFRFVICLLVFSFGSNGFTMSRSGKYFDRAIFVLFENTNYSVAIKQPYFKQLADQGAHFTNFVSATHPSQGNYIALTAGSINGVKNDTIYDVDVTHIADLLESKGLTWKVYAEDYPGNCFTGASNKDYVRKHNPFISFLNIQKNPARCANIVNSAQFNIDAKNEALPNYVFFIPNIKNDGHDTGVTYADKWYRQTFSKYVVDERFMKNTILISTFDESGLSIKNNIYTSIVGPAVKPGIVPNLLSIYSLLALIEENWSLGNLGKQDATAAVIPHIWQ